MGELEYLHHRAGREYLYYRTRHRFDFRGCFPHVDAGQMRLHVRAPIGTRIEDTEHVFAQVEAKIREVVPAHDLATISDNIGIPTFYNLAFVPTDTIGGQDASRTVSATSDGRIVALCEMRAGKLSPTRVFHL